LGVFLGIDGRLDDAVAALAEASRLDPRSALVARRYVQVLTKLHRFAAGDSIGTAVLRIEPDKLALVRYVVVTRLARGDLRGARGLLHEALTHVPARRLVAEITDFVWLMDDSVRALALRLPPQAFGEDRAGGLLTVASINWDEGRYAVARANADSARPLLEERIAQRPAEPDFHTTLAETYGYLGRCTGAVHEAERTRALLRFEPKTPEWHNFAYLRAVVAARCGDYVGAVAWADTIVNTPGPVTAAWIKVAPVFAPLRGRPDFERLVAGK